MRRWNGVGAWVLKPGHREGGSHGIMGTGGATPDLDKAGVAYWEDVWEGASESAPVDPGAPGLDAILNRRLDQFFHRALAGVQTHGARFLEVGCGNSGFLPYFASEFGFHVSGLDYSELGCEQARRILRKAGVDGEIVLGDLFHPPTQMLGAFDVVASFGVIEHFDDPAAALMSMSRLLRPGGMMISEVPNLRGVSGLVQRILCRSIYDVHVRFDPGWLRAAHQGVGLEVDWCGYMGPASCTFVNIRGWRNERLRRRASQFFRRALWLTWAVDEYAISVKPNRWTSPYLVVIARKTISAEVEDAAQLGSRTPVIRPEGSLDRMGIPGVRAPR